MENTKLKLLYKGGYLTKNLPGDKEAETRVTDIITAILARDWKGVAHQESNTVIEVYKIE